MTAFLQSVGKLHPPPTAPSEAPVPDAAISPEVSAREQAALGDAHWAQGRFDQAVERFRQAARIMPSCAEYHYKLALSAWQTSQIQLVEPALREAIRLSPREPILREALGTWHLDTGNIEQAVLESFRALELAPREPRVIVSLGFALHGNGQPREAFELIQPLLAAGADSPRLAALHGKIAPALGQEAEALALIERVLHAQQIPNLDRAMLHFIAAHLLERMEQYDQAFAHAAAGNAARRRPYDPGEHTRWVDRRLEYLTPSKLHDLPRASQGGRRPVFIIGMPRSGTSLVEQILASHPQVFGAGELAMLSRVARLAASYDPNGGQLYPDALDGISLHAANKLAAEYLSELNALDSSATYVTDKMPLNFLYLGIIAVMFPDAHVIHCTRDPLDTCLSCYFTNFTFGHEFSTDLRNLGLFHRDYQRLMHHWTRVLNFPMLEVKYEDVVNDLGGQVRRMLEYLDLPWDERCLQFYRTRRHVSTASREQVGRPIYSSSVGRWRKYEKHLDELIAMLNS